MSRIFTECHISIYFLKYDNLMLGKEKVMKVKYRKLQNVIFLKIKKEDKEIFIINEKYKKRLECSGKQTSNYTKK